MKFIPKSYQTHLIRHASEHERCAWWAGMGVGKTVSALTLLDNLWWTGDHGKTLILAPLRVAKNVWPFEQQKWDHLTNLRVSPIVGDVDERRAALRVDANVFTINYENLPWLLGEVGRKRWPFANVIADESTRLKGFRLKQGRTRSRYIASVAHTGRVRRWINLTGTPSPNGLQDLWGQTWFLDQGARLGHSYTSFMHRWFAREWGSNYKIRLLPSADVQIHDKLDDICLSVEHELPINEPVVSNVMVELPSKAMKIYLDMERQMFAHIGEFDVEVVNQANRSMKCLQIASGAAYVDRLKNWEWVHDAKLEALESVIEEFSGTPILLVYHWQPSMKRILKAFPKARLLDEKKATEQEWNRGDIPLLLVHPQSAGHGLNLQDGSNVICYFDHWWDEELDSQVFERIGPVRQHLAGHDRPVYRVNLIARDTNDAVVINRRASKATVQQALLDAASRRRAGKDIAPL